MEILRRGLVALVLLSLAAGLTVARGEAAPPGAAFSTLVTTDVANLRSGPSTEFRIAGQLEWGEEIDVVAQIEGEEVELGNATWYRLPSGRYIYSALTRAGGGESSGDLRGRRIEVDRGAQVARAIENGRVVYEAPVVVGRARSPTPVGDFQILRRVANETMDSRTVGIPLDNPWGYYLTGVLYTQYITDDGVALHYNYWTPDEAFGRDQATNGCIGLKLGDAEFFWNFADIGTPVSVRP